MAELKNTFSWSYSAGKDFETCRRKRYWAKYAMWGGWKKDADPQSRAAYRLNKMDSRHTLKGVAVEDSVMWMLKKHQAGKPVSVDEAYEAVARPFLNQAWKESKSGRWKERPKQVTCLHEHYYPEFLSVDPAEWPKTIAAEVKQCIQQFQEKILPRLKDVRPDQEVPIKTVDTGGDPESFEFDGIKVYAIPDYVHRDGETWHIHDWKSGRVSPSHAEQVAIYGLWAKIVHGIEPEHVETHVEYLMTGQTASAQLSQGDLEAASANIRASIQDMADYLEDGNLQANRPAAKIEWDMVADPVICHRCNFCELCKPELQELGI